MTRADDEGVEDKLQDLIVQATTERSHYYVRSVCEEALETIFTLKKERDELLTLISKMRAQWIHSWAKDECLAVLAKHEVKT